LYLGVFVLRRIIARMPMNYSAGGINWTPRIGRIRGMDIRLHLLLLVLVGFWLLEAFMIHGSIGFARAAMLSVGLFALILWHELGHAFAARRCGLTINGIMLWPLGGECQLSGGIPTPKTEIFVALAGPAAHLLLVLVAIPVLFLPQELGIIRIAAFNWWAVAVIILFFNLIPMFPLDGGRVLRALLTFKLGDINATRIAVRVSQGLAILLGIAALYIGQTMLVVMAVFIFMNAERELKMVRMNGGYYSGWSSSYRTYSGGNEWSREAVSRYGREEQPGFWQRLKTRRQLKKLARETELREQMKAEVDRILAKVSREGMPSLTARERKILRQASDQYRKN
jgi:Zn-dependent protease